MGRHGEGPKSHGHQGIAVGQPGCRPGMGVIQGKNEGGEGGGPSLPEPSAKQGPGSGDTCRQPEQTVGVLKDRRIRPELPVQPMCHRGDRPQEGPPDLRVGPPGEKAFPDEAGGLLRITGEKGEKFEDGAATGG